MLQAGKELDHHVHDVIGLVNVKTYQRWLREEKAGKEPGRVGRPKMSQELRDLIIRLAKDNVGWGVRKVLGELRKLKFEISRSTIRRVLVDEEILPDPNRHAPKGVVTPWRTFIAGHVETMVATDFFCKNIWTPFGKKAAYVLAFIHLGSRRVFVSPATFCPTGEWMQQQSRNVRMWAEEQGIDIRFLIHDHDTKFTEAFDEAFQREDGGVVKTPIMAPIANCFIECWIGSLKRECLNLFYCFGLDQLDKIANAYVSYHNTVRPHQGLGNVPIPDRGQKAPAPQDIEPVGQVGCQEWLGGILKHYYRKAA
ncbi:MAG: integrase core domain-containing protein [Phycisphaerae bacterium]